MHQSTPNGIHHPLISRRVAIQAGSLGLLGLGMNQVHAARDQSQSGQAAGPFRRCLYIFLSGGLAQQDSFDLKPSAPSEARGEFKPISTSTPGVQICEHLPLLAQRSKLWSLCRSMSHSTNGHTLGHYFMLTGRSVKNPEFRGDRKPRPSDHPSTMSTATYAVRNLKSIARQNSLLPPSVVLPETNVHWLGGTIPGQHGGTMGQKYDPWFIEASPYNNVWKGAYPQYNFPATTVIAKGVPARSEDRVFRAPSLTLPHGLSFSRTDRRVELLRTIEGQQRHLDEFATTQSFGRLREGAISLLTDEKVKRAFDVTDEKDTEQDRYGRNSFGWSVLMARRLLEAGVPLIQVNLGNNETWDTHGDAYPRLKNKLFPPTDKAISALLDDLQERGLLESTLVVMAGEFGRTPRLEHSKYYKLPGRDHWGAVQTVFFAGGGTRGGTVIGSSDKIAAYPADDPQKPENMAATMYHSLGIPEDAVWYDDLDRPHQIYHGQPLMGLF